MISVPSPRVGVGGYRDSDFLGLSDADDSSEEPSASGVKPVPLNLEA